MTQLVPIRIDDDTVIYIESEDVVAPLSSASTETTRIAKGPREQVVHQFQAMQGTIRTYTAYTFEAFKKMNSADVDKVTLEFGIKVAGEGGIPYVTKGCAECNLKVTVECSFPNKVATQ